MLDDTMKAKLVEEFAVLTGPVRLVMYTQEQECRYCEETRILAGEVAATSPLISLEVRDFVADAAGAAALGIDKIPALAVLGTEDWGIRFYGIPGGYEFTSLVEAVKLAGTDAPPVEAATAAILAKLSGPVAVQVFVTPT